MASMVPGGQLKSTAFIKLCSYFLEAEIIPVCFAVAI